MTFPFHRLFYNCFFRPFLKTYGSIIYGLRFTQLWLWGILFWDITQCSLLTVNRRFGRTCRLYLQDRALLVTCFRAAFLLSLFFDPEIGGKFLRNVGGLSTDYTAFYPTRQETQFTYCPSYKDVSFEDSPMANNLCCFTWNANVRWKFSG
jgi:hypothetical protein